jgi:hypothetical protein
LHIDNNTSIRLHKVALCQIRLALAHIGRRWLLSLVVGNVGQALFSLDPFR